MHRCRVTAQIAYCFFACHCCCLICNENAQFTHNMIVICTHCSTCSSGRCSGGATWGHSRPSCPPPPSWRPPNPPPQWRTPGGCGPLPCWSWHLASCLVLGPPPPLHQPSLPSLLRRLQMMLMAQSYCHLIVFCCEWPPTFIWVTMWREKIMKGHRISYYSRLMKKYFNLRKVCSWVLVL